MHQLTSTTQLKMPMVSWSRPPPLLLWILSTFQVQRSPTGRSRHGRLAPSPFPRTRIFSTSGVAVLCIFSLGMVSWRGVYLLFLQRQQLTSACLPRRVTWWLRNVHVSRMKTWTSRVSPSPPGWLQVREWEVVKKMRFEWFFLNNWNMLPSRSFLVSCFLTLKNLSESWWLWLSPAVSCLSFPLSIHTHTHTHILTIIVHYISWYWQNRHRPDFWLERLFFLSLLGFTDPT